MKKRKKEQIRVTEMGEREQKGKKKEERGKRKKEIFLDF